MDIVSRHVLRGLRNVGRGGSGPKRGWQFAVLLFFLSHAFIILNARCLASPHGVSLSLAWAAQDEALQQGLAALKANQLDLALEGDGELATVPPAETLPMTQLYFLV